MSPSRVPSVTRALLRRIEAMAVSGTEAHWARVPPDLARKLRPRVQRIADGICTLLETSDALRMNRVVGLGHRGGASERAIDEVIAFFRAARIRRFSVLLSPGRQAETIAGWLKERGFRPDGGNTLLIRDARAPIPRVTTPLRIARARRSDAEAMVRILQRVFAIPASRHAWSIAAAVAPEYEHYLALEGAKAVAVGTLRLERDLAWFGGAATLTRWRRKGAQSALIARRLRRAAAAGCRWAWVETAPLEPGRPGGSRRNLLAMGFEEVCLKPSWVWTQR